MTRFLLDTHVLLRWAESPQLVSHEARLTIASGRNTLFFSHASFWELHIKMALGKLTLPDSMGVLMQRARCKELPITVSHIEETARLPHIHGDPFDRMLIAQSRSDNLVLVTRDQIICKYELATIAA